MNRDHRTEDSVHGVNPLLEHFSSPFVLDFCSRVNKESC